MRIGILAPELSPAPGGMQEYARELCARLALDDDTVAFTRVGVPLVESTCAQRPVLTGELRRDVRSLRGESVDVWLALNAGLVALAPHLRQPVAATFHGNDFLSPWVGVQRPWLDRSRHIPVLWRVGGPLRDRLRAADLRRGVQCARAILSNSRNTTALIEQLWPGGADKIQLIHPGVADDFFQEVDRRERLDSPLQVLTVARLSHGATRKNIEGVLHAVHHLRDRAAIRYTVIGDGDDRPRLEELTRALGLVDRVTFSGVVSRTELRRAYRDADLFVLAAAATQRDVEGFGIVYLEASAAGLPVICSRDGGATDAVVDGVNGIIISGSSPGEIGEGILRFLRARERFPAPQVRGFAESFRWAHVADRVRHLLHGIVPLAAR